MLSGLAQPLRLHEISRDAVTGLQSPPPLFCPRWVGLAHVYSGSDSRQCPLGCGADGGTSLQSALPQMRKWRGLGRQSPSRAVAVATHLSVRAPQKSCSQKGGRKNSAASQPPAIPIGTRRSFAPSAGPCSQSHKTLFGVRQWGSAGSSCSCRCWCQDPRGNPGVASFAALPPRDGLRRGCTWPEARSGAVSPTVGR